jgi:hypothetical protein
MKLDGDRQENIIPRILQLKGDFTRCMYLGFVRSEDLAH